MQSQFAVFGAFFAAWIAVDAAAQITYPRGVSDTEIKIRR